MIRKGLAAGLVLCGLANGALALEREATLINWLEVEAIGYKDMHAYRAGIWGETQVFRTPDWAVVLGVGGGILGQSGLADETGYMGALGVKWYATDCHRLSALASYEAAGADAFRIVSGTIGYEWKRDAMASSFAPFLFLNGAVQSVRPSPWLEADDFTAFLLKVGAGCDILMSEDFVMSFRASWNDSSKLSGDGYGDYGDGWGIALAMKYFWQ